MRGESEKGVLIEEWGEEGRLLWNSLFQMVGPDILGRWECIGIGGWVGGNLLWLVVFRARYPLWP